MTPRRALWLFRLVSYPGAALAVVLLLAHRGVPLFITTRVRATCPGGIDWEIDWRPHAHADGHVSATWFYRYPGEIGEIRMTLDGDPGLTRGVLTITERFTQPGGYSFVCASGRVPFGASVSGLRNDSEDRT